ncbi:MAG: hypothetical protein RL065_480, partial [Bacteroidota bacterium]
MKNIFAIILLLVSINTILAQGSWYELGGYKKSLNANGEITSITSDQLGNVYAVGLFSDSLNFWDGNKYVAKWDGSSWSKLAPNSLYSLGNFVFGNEIYYVKTDQFNNVYIGGHFKDTLNNYFIAKWDGNSWSKLSGNSLRYQIYGGDIEIDNFGTIYTSGHDNFNPSGTTVLYWNGSDWQKLKSSTDSIDVNGDIYRIIA